MKPKESAIVILCSEFGEKVPEYYVNDFLDILSTSPHIKDAFFINIDYMEFAEELRNDLADNYPEYTFTIMKI